MKRIRYTVSKVKAGWRIKRAGQAVGTFGEAKAGVVRRAADLARSEWKLTGALTELIIMGAGKRGVMDNRTYGRDSRRTRG